MATARQRKLYMEFLFTVLDTTYQLESAKFQKATGLEMAFEVAEYSEGGAHAPMKEPARTSFANVSLSRGVSDSMDFYNWCMQLTDMLSNFPEGAGSVSPDFMRDLIIQQRDRDQAIKHKYFLYATFPTRWKPGNWDNDSGNVQIEELELAQWFFDKEQA